MLFESGDARTPAQINTPQLVDSLDQETLNVELLDVDEGWLVRQLETALLAQVERVDLVMAGKSPTDAPLDTLGSDALVNTQALEDLQRLLRVANAAR